MSMKKKVKCPYHGDGVLAYMHPEYDKFPSSCPWCFGRLEYELDVHLHYYKGKFKSVNWNKIDRYSDEVYAGFACSCGDEISLSEGGDNVVCSCGRIYRISFALQVDELHIGDTYFLLAESDRKK